MKGESIIWLLSYVLETDIAFGAKSGLKQTHSADQPIVEESLSEKKLLQEKVVNCRAKARRGECDHFPQAPEALGGADVPAATEDH
jgi:hypothetical protein